MDLHSYGLNLEILRQIPGRVMAVIPETKNCFLVTTVKDNFWLWLHQGREDNLTDQLSLMNHCWQQGFTGLAAVVPLRNGQIYGKADERCWFYLAKWTRFEKVSYRNLDHLITIIHLMAAFRRSVADWSFPGLVRSKEPPKLLAKMKETVRYLEAFEMLARHRINVTKFDRLYLEILVHLKTRAAESVTLLENSRYQELITTLKADNLVINDFSRGNLRVDQDGQVRLLRLKYFRWDLPIMDLAVLLVKSGRSQRWKHCWYETLLAEYQKTAALGAEELAIIKAYLCFPWNICHLISRYYLNRVTWPTYLFVDKLGRLIVDEENRIRLIAGI
jgi:CotS family spore coat protein